MENSLSQRLETAVKENRWNEVNSLLKDNNYSNSVVEQFVTTCEKFGVISDNTESLSHCYTNQLDRLLSTTTTRALWHMVNRVLKVGGSLEKRVWVINQACETADNRDFDLYILPHIDGNFLSQCSTEQLDTWLTTATTRGLWHMVNRVMKVGGSREKRVWVVTHNWDFELSFVDNDFLSHCCTEQLDTWLTTATTRGLWHMVNRVMKVGGSHEKRSWVVEQASDTCDYEDFESYILPHVDHEFLSHCSTEQLDTLLTIATTRRLWHMVNTLFKAGGSHEKRVWVIEQACKMPQHSVHWYAWPFSEGDYFKHYILLVLDSGFLSNCSTEQLDTLLTTATTRRVWHMVNTLLKAGGSHEKRSWVVEQASETCDYKDFESYVLPHVDDDFLSQCSTEQLDTLLTTATTRRLWHMVNTMLKAAVSHEKRSWVVEQASKTCDYKDFESYILPHVDGELLSTWSTEQLDNLLTTATTRGLWHMVQELLQAESSHDMRVWVIEQACKFADRDKFERYILQRLDGDFLSQCSTEHMDTLLTAAATEKWWRVVGTLLNARCTCSHKIRVWIIEQACKTAGYLEFERYILPHVDQDFLSHSNTEQLDCFLTTATTRGLWHMVHSVLKAGGSHKKRMWVIEEACKTVSYNDFMEYILSHCSKDQMDCALEHFETRGQWECVAEMLKRGISGKSKIMALSEACKGCTYTSVIGRMQVLGESSVQLLISFLPSNQLFHEAQNVALRFAAQQRKWDVISRACLSQVWEQVRRHLFREAVNQRQWTFVKKQADHALYDDERWWALEEAYKLKQWDVMLQLADHGLTEIELMRVRYRLAKHADWDVVLRMIGRGVDLTELREVVESAAVSRKTAADEAKRHALALRWKELRLLEEKMTHLEETLARASDRRFILPLTAQQWNTVLFHLHRHPGTFTRASSHHQRRRTVGELLLQRAIQQRRWHIVMHLVTLGMDTEKLNSLLTDMIRKRQWGVCRVLLKQGVSVQSCLHALPVFIEKTQWALVARVMEFIEHDALKHQMEQLALDMGVGSLVWQCVSAMCRYGMCVGDEVRLHVMHRAMEWREGSVVGQCIGTMQHYGLSVKERENQFQQAISRGVLQAVKPLVEEKKETEFQHRDATLLAGIEQRQWDVVDCCQLQGADIDMKDERGETPLNREARNGEWKAVEELAVRGANPNVLDKDGCSVLNRAIHVHQWEIVRLLIVCLGNIHKSARYEPDYELDYESRYHSDSESDNESPPLLSKGEVPTPLQLLIDKRQGEIIEHTLIWSPDQSKGVNDEGETTLHAVVLDKKPELLYYQIVRGVNPLELTKGGHSVLLYAVGNEHCPQKMVAECIRLGFSTHQPRLRQMTAVDIGSVAYCLLYGSYHDITSPFLLAVLRGLQVVAHMLYESGSCSYAELLQLFTILLDCSDPHSETGRQFVEEIQPGASDQRQQRYATFMNTLTTFLPYLREMASTPRSLVSTCRLVISHSLTVHRRRERAVQDLDLTDRMKNYLLFSDLTDPDYQLFIHGTVLPEPPPRKRRKLAQ